MYDPIDSGLKDLVGKSDVEIARLAKTLTYLRGLSPYPLSQQQFDRMNSDETAIARQRIWEALYENHREVPYETPWHLATRLTLRLGNELSRSIFVEGCFEPNEFAFLNRMLRPGMCFLDIGAHEGAYAVFAARRVGAAGHVYAFEPSRREFRHLSMNVANNDLACVESFQCALGDLNGSAPLHVARSTHSGHNTLGRFVWDGVELDHSEDVALRTLDSIVGERRLPHIDALKMDVEGSELRVLRGAADVLREMRPVVLFEASNRSLSAQGSALVNLIDVFRSADYAIYSFDFRTGLPIPYAAPHRGDNLLAVPSAIGLN
jgi:FkbM family methyltransferase